METSRCLAAPAILIVKSDRLYAEAIRQLTVAVFPRARVQVETTLAGASAALAAAPADLLIAGLGTSEAEDMLNFLAGCTHLPGGRLRVLVVTGHLEHRIVTMLRTLPIKGVFDSGHEPPARFSVALQAVADGQAFWSPSILEKIRQQHAAPNSRFRLLTVCEQMVLSVLGDGSDDMTAADELGLSPATVGTIRRDLHRKLGIQHRGALMRFAAQNGFVRFTETGVVRPGFALLSAAYHARRAVLRARPPEAAPALHEEAALAAECDLPHVAA